MRRRLVVALVVMGVLLVAGARTAGAAERRDDVTCDGQRLAAGVVVEDVGSAAPAELPPFVAPFPVPNGFEQIHQYDVDVATNPDGSADFVETIVYDFGRTPDRHGILRELRLTQPCNEQWDRAYPMTKLTVSSPTGAPTKVETDTANGITVLKIGDADKNVQGVQTYILQYHLAGVINPFADHDEFYWNAIGPGWDVTDAHLLQITNFVTCHALHR